MTFVLLLALACGTDHAPEKHLVDPGAARALAPAPQATAIAALDALPRTARRRAYVVTGTVTAIKHEADTDTHLALSDGHGHTLIVEAPDPRCATGSPAIAAIKRARRQAAGVRVGQRVRVIGVAFFDKMHGQTGAAPNGVEIHPLLKLEVLR